MSNSSSRLFDVRQSLQNPFRLNGEQLNFSVSGSSSQVRSSPGCLDSTAQTGGVNAGDWQEEVFQKIKAMNDLYYADLSVMHQKISIKLQQAEFVPQQLKIEQLDKLKLCKQMLEKLMLFLQTAKNNIFPVHRDKLPSFEKQIIGLLNSQRPKKSMPPMQLELAPCLTSMQEHQQSHSQSTFLNLPSHAAGGSGNPPDRAEFLMMDSSCERTSHIEPRPMDGGDRPTQLPQMDLNCETPSQAEPLPPMVGEDWRTQLLPDSRQKVVKKILDTLRGHLPVSGEEGLQELRKIAIRFEEKIYSAATSQSDYLRKISLKMLTMESKSQTSSGTRLATWAPSSSNPRQQELERIADNTEQTMRAAVTSQPDYIRKMNILNDAFDEFKSQSTLHNALPSNSTAMSGNPPGLEQTHGWSSVDVSGLTITKESWDNWSEL